MVPFRVGIIGPESTGKSTLARYLAKRYHGLYVPEYAREVVEKKGSKELTYDEVCAIARHQIDELSAWSETVFYDTDLIVTKVWLDYAFGKVPEWIDQALRKYPMDVYLLTYPDTPWVPDPARYNGSDAIRKELFDRYEAEIQALDVPYYIIKHTN